LPFLPKLLELKLNKNYKIKCNLSQFPSLIKLNIDKYTWFNVQLLQL